ncbi:MAG TPA: hypothetical protein VH247_07560 [Thermoleophilaceae bacterium]|jgi:hypothetical protein|nr:hypothetical protein [Thermoleophilaceae bacterium]
MFSKKFLALAVALCALALVPVALAAGLTVTTTPTKVKRGKTVQMKVSGLKPNEKVKAVELIADGGQKATYFPKQRASAGGAFVNTVKAQIKGKHTWTYTGRTSRRTGKTSYTVR